MKKISTIAKIGGIAAVSALALSACGASNTGGDTNAGGGDASGGESGTDWSDCTPGQDSAAVGEVDENTEITIGAFNGWDESYAAAHLLKAALEQDGYTAEVESFDAGPGFLGLSQGDIDVLLDGWLPLTHADYVEQYGDDIEAQGCWYDNAKLTIAVNEDSEAQTIADLADMGDAYGSRLVGIEPGAGLTRVTQDEAIPTYGLEDWEFVTSSTPAMLAELKSATEAGEDIAVTLWRPHWAYDAFPVRDLEDPEGAMGDAEIIYNFSRSGFGEENPYVAQLLKNLVINDENLSSLENLMMSEEHHGGNDHDAAVAEWLEENPDFIDQWKAGELG